MVILLRPEKGSCTPRPRAGRDAGGVGLDRTFDFRAGASRHTKLTPAVRDRSKQPACRPAMAPPDESALNAATQTKSRPRHTEIAAQLSVQPPSPEVAGASNRIEPHGRQPCTRWTGNSRPATVGEGRQMSPGWGQQAWGAAGWSRAKRSSPSVEAIAQLVRYWVDALGLRSYAGQ